MWNDSNYYNSLIWKVSDWDEEKLRYVLSCCKKLVFEDIATPGVTDDSFSDYLGLMDIITLKLMVIKNDFNDFNKSKNYIESPHELYLALRYAINWCRYNKGSKCSWVLGVPEDIMSRLSPQYETLKAMADNSPQIDVLMEQFELTVEDETEQDGYQYYIDNSV